MRQPRGHAAPGADRRAAGGGDGADAQQAQKDEEQHRIPAEHGRGLNLMPESGSTSGQVSAEHPSHFFMVFHQAGDKIARPRVLKITGERVDVFAQENNDAFVVRQQFPDEPLTVIFLARLFRELGQLEKFFQCGWRVMAQLADAFCHTVHDFVQLLILRFKKGVHGMKIPAFKIPMCLAGFGIQNEFVGQQTGQLRRHDLAIFVRDSNICVHSLFAWNIAFNQERPAVQAVCGAEGPNALLKSQILIEFLE
jgi:hypothetical protein